MSLIEERPVINEVYEKLIKARKEFAVYRKDGRGNVGGRSYNYATLEDILQAIRPALDENDLFLSQPIRYIDGRYFVETLIFDSKGSVLELGVTPIISSVEVRPKVGEPYMKEDAQTLGSGMTYARRYGLVSALGLISDEDDDGQLASIASPLDAIRANVRKLANEAHKDYGYSLEEITATLKGVSSEVMTQDQAYKAIDSLSKLIEMTKKGKA